MAYIHPNLIVLHALHSLGEVGSHACTELVEVSKESVPKKSLRPRRTLRNAVLGIPWRSP